MTALGFLGLLLVASYLGGFVIGGQKARARGLASGAGTVLLGFVVGPSVLGLVSRDSLDLFIPLAQVGVGWLAMDAGLVFGRVLGRRMRPASALWGIGIALFCAAGVSGAVFAGLTWVPRLSALGLTGTQRWVLVLGTGAALGETTRSVFRWAARRCNAKGPLFDRLADLAAGDDLVPVLLAAVAVALQPVPSVWGPLPVSGGAAAQLAGGLGIGCGGGDDDWQDLPPQCLSRRPARRDAGGDWVFRAPRSFSPGAAVRAGARARVRVPPPGPGASSGPLRAICPSPHSLSGRGHDAHRRRRAMAGGGGGGARLVMKTLTGIGLWAVWPEARPAGPWLGAGLVSSGTLSICVGLSFALRFPGLVGLSVLAASTLSVVVGELMGPASLRRALQKAGEVHEVVPEPPSGEVVGASA